MAPTLVVLAAGLARRYGGCKPLAPVGLHGEAVIDLLAADAVRAGFGRIVLVLHPQTGPAIRYHVERSWPAEVDVAFATQRLPLGTTHATLAARAEVGDGSFAVANADDVYGQGAMASLVDALGADDDAHVLVGYALAHTVVTDDPVTRGVCEVGDNGALRRIWERRHVARADDGVYFVASDGHQPDKLDGATTVSLNLWGFRPSIWGLFEAAMAASGLDEATLLAEGNRVERPRSEVLLPEVIGAAVEAGTTRVRVVPTPVVSVGVTHADDLPVVQATLARQIAWGVRPESTWAGTSAATPAGA